MRPTFNYNGKSDTTNILIFATDKEYLNNILNTYGRLSSIYPCKQHSWDLALAFIPDLEDETLYDIKYNPSVLPDPSLDHKYNSYDIIKVLYQKQTFDEWCKERKYLVANDEIVKKYVKYLEQPLSNNEQAKLEEKLNSLF